jgi:long-chain acyl-CoA synthetase
MVLSYDEAVAAVTAPGERYEIVEAEVRGRPVRVFEQTPPSLRWVFATARARGDEPFVVYENERWSFEHVADHVDALGAALVERYGVAKGDRVALAMRNYPEWVVAYAAVTSIGAVVVPLNAWWTTDELGYGLRQSGSRVVIADRERIERLAALAGPGDGESGPGLRVLGVRLPDGFTPAGLAVDRYEDVVDPDAGLQLPDIDIDPDDDATILYTSGTTGNPKGAVSTHRAVCSALLSYGCRSAVQAAMRGGVPDEPKDFPTSFILVVPLFHVTGCIPVMLSSYAAGYKLVMMYKWNPERALELIEREHVTTFVGVPTMSWDLLESPDFATRDTSSLVSVAGGGAPAPAELVRRVDKSFSKARPAIGYGMTETNAYGPQNIGDDYVRKPTSAGRAVPTMQVRVVDEQGEPVPAGEVGEIEFYGPNLIRGYWQNPEATAATFHDGWLRTGDLGRIDDEGFIYVEDRAKDMVIRAGENIYCAEVEGVLYEHPAVYEAAVFGIPHERLGEELVAALVLRPDATVTEDEIRQHVGAHLAAFKVPSRIEFSTTQLPRSAAGKILKRELRDSLLTSDS